MTCTRNSWRSCEPRFNNSRPTDAQFTPPARLNRKKISRWWKKSWKATRDSLCSIVAWNSNAWEANSRPASSTHCLMESIYGRFPAWVPTTAFLQRSSKRSANNCSPRHFQRDRLSFPHPLSRTRDRFHNHPGPGWQSLRRVLVSSGGRLTRNARHPQSGSDNRIHRLVFRPPPEIGHHVGLAVLGRGNQYADFGRGDVDGIRRRALRDNLVRRGVGKAGHCHSPQFKAAAADIDLGRTLTVPCHIGNGHPLWPHTFRYPNVPTAPHLVPRRRYLRDDSTFGNLSTEKAVRLFEYEPMRLQRAFGIARSHANDLGNVRLPTVNRKTHRRKCRRHEDHDQHQHTYQPAEEAAHQCVSPSPGVWSVVSTFWATAFGGAGGGAAKSSDSRPSSATRIKSIQIGKAATAPVSLLPSVFFSSKPTHTPQVSDGENPTNQASVKSFVVPVLPPSGWLSLAAAAPVPRRTTSRNISTIMRAVRALTTSFTSGR